MQYGILGHFTVTGVSQKWAFKTGVLFFKNNNTNFFKIPLHIEYNYPGKGFRPRLSYGTNIYFPGFQSVSLTLGANIKIANNSFLTLSSELEFHARGLLLPSSYLAHGFLAGVFFNL